MENIMTNGFTELSSSDMMEIDGGGLKEVGYAVGGTLLVAFAPAAGVATGFATSLVATPVAGVAAGVSVGAGMGALGFSWLDKATS